MIFNLPNLLSLFRLVAAFVFLAFAIQDRWEIAVPVFCAGALSDLIDGTIARLLHQRSRIGAVLDPMADKLLMFFGALMLTLKGFLPPWFVMIVLSRDLMISGGAAFLKWKGAVFEVIPTYLSKGTTALQGLTLVLALFKAQNFLGSHAAEMEYYGYYLIRSAGVMTIVTGIQYFRMGWEILQSEKVKTHRQ